jgi:transcriptional regulator with XRE-family HTH domain
VASSDAARFIAEAITKHGLTQKQAGAFLGVSDRMVRQVLSGAKPGANLAAAARQLAKEGRVTTPPARREQRVRDVGGGTRKVLKPAEQRHTVEGGGRSQSAVAVPKRGVGRTAARQAIRDALGARRGGRKGIGGQRVTFTITTTDGRTITLGSKGGYDPQAVVRRIDDEGGDPFDWIGDEIEAVGAYDLGGVGSIAAVSMSFV